MKFALWLESVDEELGLLRNVISNVSDIPPMLVLADWLEENSRPEAPWVRAVANRQTRRPSRYISNQYVRGVQIGMRAATRTRQFIQDNSYRGANPPAEAVTALAAQWNNILQTPSVMLAGSRVAAVIELPEFGGLTYYPVYDVWMIVVRHEDGEGPVTAWYGPHRLESSQITPALYWIALCALLRLDGVIS